MVRALLAGLLILMLNVCPAFAEEAQTAPANTGIAKVVEKIMGKETKIIRVDALEKSPVEGWKQIRVWIESAYGETPILFYSTEDGNFIFAGSIFSASGENLTKKDVGETKPKSVENAKMELNEDYRIGNKDSLVKAVLWIGADPYSRELFETFYDLYNKNKDKVVLYVKFYPRSGPDMEKIKALTCFKNDALVHAIRVIYDANPAWGTQEHLDAFKNTGDQKACNDELVVKDLKLATALKLPVQPVAFVNGTMLIDKATKENIMKLSGIELK